MEIKRFGFTKMGREVNLYTLENSKGMQAKIMNLGATVVSLLVPDQEGRQRDVVLGYDSVADYEKDGNCFGAVIGRNANRIKGTHILIDEFEYVLDDNDNGNNLHSGFHGFHHEVWGAMYSRDCNHQISFCYESPEGSQGFPGTVNVSVSYELTENNKLIIHYEAETDRKTIVNLTNHTYFNLNGHDSGTAYDQKIALKADCYTPLASTGMCPTGEIASVEGTPFDFRRLKSIGRDIMKEDEQLTIAGGYDHNFVTTNEGLLCPVAKAVSEQSGISMVVISDRPGVQLYTGNFIGDAIGKGGARYGSRHGFCFETQCFPDAIHHKNFPSPLLDPKQKFDSTTEFEFGLI